jgi:amino-acid N-acetyltransferase
MTASSHNFVHWFRHSTPYIHAHRGRIIVLSFPGEILHNQACFTSLIHDIALLNGLGVKLVLVPGVRPQIEHCLAQAGIPSKFIRGLRVTDTETLHCIKAAAGSVRVDIEALLSMGLADSPMAGTRIRVVSGNFVTAKPIGVLDGIDFQQTGEVRRIDVNGLQDRLADNQIVLIPPLGYSPTGEVFNLNTTDIASETAIALQANKLIYLTEGDLGSTITLDKNHMLPEEAEALYATPSMSTDYQHVLRNAAIAAQNGVKRTHILDRHLDGALLSELFTREGVGILVAAKPPENVRPATLRDLPQLLKLMQPFADADILIKRSQATITQNITHFLVIESDHCIVACVALLPFAEEKLGELACLAVDTLYNKAGLGHRLLEAAEQQAQKQGLHGLFALSTQTGHWFLEHGFQTVTPEQLPKSRQAQYDKQRQSKVFLKQWQ